MITAAGKSDIGCKRSTNEDRILVDLDHAVFVLADGMGGERCGDRAAEIATSTLGQCFDSPLDTSSTDGAPQPGKIARTRNLMARAIQLANERVYGESVSFPECAGMGCTLSAMAMAGNSIIIGHVGDSRAYLYRNSTLSQLTRDDSIVANLIANGEITASEARSHPMRNRLTQSVGFSKTVTVQLLEVTLSPGDRLLLTSDGVHGVIGDTGIQEVLASADPPETTAQNLIQAVRAQGAPDNTSSIVVDYS
jgi:PPM family protein phosphatase